MTSKKMVFNNGLKFFDHLINISFFIHISLIINIFWIDTALATGTDSKVNVVVSFSIIEDLTQQIGKDRVNVTSLIDRGSEAHDFEPRAKHILILKNADLFIFNGLNFEPWAERFLDQNHFTKIRLNLGNTLKLAPQDRNPHAWQDPELLIKYVNLIKEALIEFKPTAKIFFEQNALALTEDIRRIHNGYLTKINKLPKPRWLITPHNGFYHLAKAYGFEYIYLSNSGHNENLSAKTIKQLIDQIKPLKNALLFDEWGNQSSLLATIQKETQQKNGGFLFADTLTRENEGGYTIQDYLRYNDETLLKAYSK
jgi:zinc/manganese transport system substrate-binding protein